MKRVLASLMIGIIVFTSFSIVPAASANDTDHLNNYDCAGVAIPSVSNLEDTVSETEETQLPDSVNNSSEKWFPPIGDQTPYGTCAAFATTYYQYTYSDKWCEF